MVSGGGIATTTSESSKRSELLCVSPNMKKGSWTTAEDAILMEYVNKHGEGNWMDVHRKTGLMRCGRSCRQRWVNYLRPNLKKGSFSPDEERIIVDLHSKLGNKWSRMASHLPGRTDTEIKNYCNTRMRRLQRDVLPIYPRDFQENSPAPPIFATLHPHPHHHQLAKRPQNNNNNSFMLVQSQNQPPTCNPPPSYFSFINASNFSSDPLQSHHQEHASSFYSIPNNKFEIYSDSSESNDYSIPPTVLSPFTSHAPPLATTNLYNHNIAPEPSTYKFNGGGGNGNYHYEPEMSFSSMLMEASLEPIDHFGYNIGVVVEPTVEVDLLSKQTPPQVQPTTPYFSAGSSRGGVICDDMVHPSRSNHINDDVLKMMPRGNNTGLLDEIVHESQNHSRQNSQSKGDRDFFGKGKGVVDVYAEDEGDESVMKKSGHVHVDKEWDDLSSPSSIGMKLSFEEAIEDKMYSMDDDLTSLLDNFPMSLPLPEWYPQQSSNGGGSSSNITGGGNGDTQQHNTRPAPSDAATTISKH